VVNPDIFKEVPLFHLLDAMDYRVNLKAELEIEELLQRIGKLEKILVEQDTDQYG
jgi:uncharacterized membrane protein